MYTCIRTGYQCVHVSGLGINVYMYQVRTGINVYMYQDWVSMYTCIRLGLGINVYMYQDWVSMCTCIRLGLGINVYMYQARTGYQCIHVSG